MERTGTRIDLQDEVFLEHLKKIKLNYPNRGLSDLQIEQISFRVYLCTKCIANKKCQFCKCNPYDVLSEPMSCNKKKIYPDFMSKAEWDKFKLENNIEIK